MGTWPAIWMLGTRGAWPDDGEIDSMEQPGKTAIDKARILGTIHTRAHNDAGGAGTVGIGQGGSTTVSDACTSFHCYQMTWHAIRIGVDGMDYFEYRNPKRNDHGTWPFDNPQFLILNFAIGGDLGGALPVRFVSDQMEVDHVRVYQRKSP